MFEGMTIEQLVSLYNKPLLAAALVKAMSEIESIDKNSTVKTGGNGFYKAVQDKDVKIAVRKILINNGLTIIPAHIEDKTERVEKDKNGYKSSEIFVNCKTTFIILHTSGEAVPAQGIGHGIDSLDKAAGKATTYALKYFELYLFQIPTGDIDDADKTEPETKTETKPTTTPANKQAQQKPASKPVETKEEPKTEVKEKDIKDVNQYILDSTDMKDLTTRWNELSIEQRKLGKEAKDKKKAEFSPTK